MSDKFREVILESGIAVRPVYGPEDLEGIDPARDIGQPGASSRSRAASIR